MTPKEEAKKIFNTYWELLMMHEVLHRKLFTKQCALIAVDKILEHCYQVMKPFWQEVKNEIEKL